MSSSKSNSIFVLKLIGSLFSVVTIAMVGIILYLLPGLKEQDSGIEYQGFMVSSTILTFATATIAVFIWWIVSNKRRFLNFE